MDPEGFVSDLMFLRIFRKLCLYHNYHLPVHRAYGQSDIRAIAYLLPYVAVCSEGGLHALPNRMEKNKISLDRAVV
jgi:hypothetical protein